MRWDFWAGSQFHPGGWERTEWKQNPVPIWIWIILVKLDNSAECSCGVEVYNVLTLLGVYYRTMYDIFTVNCLMILYIFNNNNAKDFTVTSQTQVQNVQGNVCLLFAVGL